MKMEEEKGKERKGGVMLQFHTCDDNLYRISSLVGM
jgi:hypothetical protein